MQLTKDQYDRIVKANNASEVMREIANETNTAFNTVKKFFYIIRRDIENNEFSRYLNFGIEVKEEPVLIGWREIAQHARKQQELKSKLSTYSPDESVVKIETDNPITIMFLGDTQLGSWGVDYDAFESITEEILNTPNLYVILMGDLLQMAIKMRSVIEVSDMIISQKAQFQMLESWLDEIKHKVICAVWCNHVTMREENVLGWSPTSYMMASKVRFFNQIGHLDLMVNNIVYKFALSHFFSGRSMYNNLHACMRYLRMQGQDRDIAVQGDTHVPGITKYVEGNRTLCAIVNGSIQNNSGYAKRFFSLKTHSAFPCIKLNHEEKIFTPFYTLEDAMN